MEYKKIFKILVGLLALPILAYAQFTTTQGGTGTSSPSGILYGDGTLHLKTLNIGSGCTFSSGTLTCPGTGGGSSFGFPFTVNTGYNSTTTTIGFLTGGIFTNASSTFSGPVRFPAISQGVLYTGTGGLLTSFSTTTGAFYPNKTIIWIDSNRTDTYTADGSILKPYTTITAANTAVGLAGYTAATYNLAPGTGYTEQSITMPNIPLVIYGNGSTIILLSGASVGAGSMTISSDIDFYNPVIFGALKLTATSLTNPHGVHDGFIAGNVSFAGNSIMNGSAVVDQNTATFPFLSQSASSTVEIGSGSLVAILLSNIQSVINDYGTLNLNSMNIQTATSTRYAVVATSTGSVLRVDGLSLQNTGTGGGISCANGTTSSNPNQITAVQITLGAGSTNAINCGSATTFIGTYTAFTTAGVRLFATGSDKQLLSAEGFLVDDKVSIGTSTPYYQFTIASSTGPQMYLGDGVIGNYGYIFRSVGNTLAIGTTTAQGNATSTVNNITINSNGYVGIATNTPNSLFSINGVVNFDTSTTSFSSTGGINLKTGCFSINSVCVSGSGGGGSGTVTSITNGVGFVNQGTSITSSGTLTAGVATSATPSIGGLSYWTSTGSGSLSALLGTVATGTITCTGTASCTTTGLSVVGGNLTIVGAAGAGSGLATSTADYIISNSTGYTTTALKTSNNTVVSTNTDAGVVIRAVLADATSTVSVATTTNIMVKAGTYYMATQATFCGNNDNYGPTFSFHGNGIDSTNFVTVGNVVRAFELSCRVKVDMGDFSIYMNGTSDGIGAAGLTTGVRSVWQSNFKNIFFNSTTTPTGIGMNIQNGFRNSYENIESLTVQLLKDSAQGTAFFTGDSVYSNMFCDLSSTSGTFPCYEFTAPAGGQVNQSTLTGVNAFSDTGTHTGIKLTNTNWMVFRNINSEGFSTSTEIISGTGNTFDFAYITLKSTAGTTYFYTSDTAYNNSFGCKYLDNPANAHRIWLDNNTLAGQGNVLQGVNGANCVIQGTGTYTFATTTNSVVRDLYDNVAGATYLSGVKIANDKLYFTQSGAQNTFTGLLGGALRTTVLGTEILTATNARVGVSSSTPGTVFSIGAQGTGWNFVDNGTTTASGNGINLRNGGCFAVQGVCVGSVSGGSGTVTSVVAGAGFQNRGLNITSSGTLVTGIATSATPVLGGLSYWTGVGDTSNPAGLGTVATTSVTAGTGVSFTTFSAIGASPITILSVPDVIYTTQSGTRFYTSSTTATDNLSWLYRNGIVSQASSTFTSTLFIPSIVTKTLNVDSVGQVYGTATSTPTVTAPITYSGTLGQFISGVSGTFDCTAAAAGVKGCLTGADYNIFTAKDKNEKWATSTDGYTIYPNVLQLTSIGTTTSRLFPLTVASSTVPQISLGDGLAGNSQFTLRTAGNTFALTTTTAQGLATSSQNVLTVNTNGFVGISSTSPSSLFSINNVVNFDPATTSFSSVGGINLKDGCFSVKGVCVGGTSGGSGTITAVGDVSSGAAFNGTQGTTLTFFSATANKTMIYDGIDFNFSTSTDIPNNGAYRIGNVNALIASSTGSVTLVGLEAGKNLLATTTSTGHGADTVPGNTALGYQALGTATSSEYMTAIGYRALASAINGGFTNSVGFNNTALGYKAQELTTTGTFNTSIGAYSLPKLTTGNDNAALGYNSLGALTTGTANVGVGDATLGQITTGSYNTGVGYGAGDGINVTDTGNVFIGGLSGGTFSGGDGNVLIGYNNINNNLIGGGGNIFIGASLDATSSTAFSNELNIGNVLFGTGIYNSTTTVSGTPSVQGKIGIGTSSPKWLLHLDSSTAPQLSLSVGAGVAQWTMRNAGGDLFFSTTTTQGIATTSTAALTLKATGKPGLGVSTSTANATLTVETRAGDYSNAFFIGSSSELLRVDSGGHIFAPNTTLQGGAATDYWCYDASGQFIRVSAICTTSARRFKKDIQPLDMGLNDLLKLQPVSYLRKDPLDEMDSHLQIGFIADDVAKVSPKLNETLVTYVDGGTSGTVQGFRYDQFTALLTQSIKDLNTKVENLPQYPSKVKRSVEENWQWLAISLLFLVVLYQGNEIRKLKK